MFFYKMFWELNLFALFRQALHYPKEKMCWENVLILFEVFGMRGI